MEYVNVIKDIVVEKIPYVGQNEVEFRQYIMNDCSSLTSDHGLLLCKENLKHQVVPVKRWLLLKTPDILRDRKSWGDPTVIDEIIEKDYIALSPYVNDVLGKYLKIINVEFVDQKSMIAQQYMENEKNTYRIQELKHKRNTLNSSFWERLKYLFKGISYEVS